MMLRAPSASYHQRRPPILYSPTMTSERLCFYRTFDRSYQEKLTLKLHVDDYKPFSQMLSSLLKNHDLVDDDAALASTDCRTMEKSVARKVAGKKAAATKKPAPPAKKQEASCICSDPSYYQGFCQDYAHGCRRREGRGRRGKAGRDLCPRQPRHLR
jgi:hypothetical protein